ncbi:MAG TPA: hypothetical protein VFZ53_25845 [Polyangiaceae bacterium]
MVVGVFSSSLFPSSATFAPGGWLSMRSRVERALIWAIASVEALVNSPFSPAAATYASYARTASCGRSSFSSERATLYVIAGEAWSFSASRKFSSAAA